MMMVVVIVVAPFFAVIDVTSGRNKLSGSPGCSNSLLESSNALVGSSDGCDRSSDGVDPCGQTKSFSAYYAKAGAHGAA
jgi:hypothetical protein